MKRLLSLSALAAALFTACPPQGVVCKAGTVPCGLGCVDPLADRRNCGACGIACGSQQDCVPDDSGSAACQCRAGTEACTTGCAVTSYDAQNCGSCGHACDDGLVCQEGQCQASCENGALRCGASCVDALNDLANCGGCGVRCAQGQTCTAGQCLYGAVAACYWSGQLVGFDPATGVKGPLSDVGTNPAALAHVDDTVFVADGTDQRLYSAVPAAGGAYAQTNAALTTGAVPNHFLHAPPYLYVTNAGAGTVLVLKAGETGGRVNLVDGVDAGAVYGAIAEVQLGMNSFPQAAALLGSTLYVPLYGGFTAETADAGQTLALVDVSDPSAPTVTGEVSLKTLDLHAFDGGAPVPRPWAITARADALYVALNNLNADSYVAEGPGLLAKVVPADAGLGVIDLGADCLNPQWVAPVGEGLAVSCGGRATYTGSALTQLEGSGVVYVDATDTVAARWVPANGTLADGGAAFWLPGRLTTRGDTVVVTDQFLGRVAVLEVADGGLAPVQASVSLCPVSELTGVANVSDVSF